MCAFAASSRLSISSSSLAFRSASGAFPEIVDRPEVGRLFAGDSPEALAQALLETFELSRDPATRRICRERAEAFSVSRTVAAYEALYARLLGG